MDHFKPVVDDYGEEDLAAWLGTPGYDALNRLCKVVFPEDLASFSRALTPKLDPSLFTEVSQDLAVDLNGTAVALNGTVSRTLDFLHRDDDVGPLRRMKRRLCR